MVHLVYKMSALRSRKSAQVSQMGCVTQSLILAIILCVVMLLPDMVFGLITQSHRPFWNNMTALSIGMCALSLSFVSHISVVRILWGIFFLLELIQFHHIIFFGVPITSSGFNKIFSEAHDVFDLAYLQQVWFVAPVLLLVYGIGWSAFGKWRGRKKSSWAYLLLIPSLLWLSSLEKLGQNFPRPCVCRGVQNSLKASLTTFGCFLQNVCRTPTQSYIPYKIFEKKTQAKNIVVVMGESCSASHMSLYGYPRMTTPHLQKYTELPNFIFRKGVSASISTRESLILFVNVVREPGNIAALTGKECNLFNRAWAHGFKTFLVSGNSHRGFDGTINTLISKKQFYKGFGDISPLFDVRGDEALVDHFKQLELGEKNFIILHMRNLHGPYQANYAHVKSWGVFSKQLSEDYKQRVRDEYDDAMLYCDEVLRQLLGVFQERFKDKGESYFIFTSDHGELLYEPGDTGQDLLGHGFLDTKAADVPFFMYHLNGSREFLDFVNTFPSTLSYYDMGVLVLDRLGYSLFNPNRKKVQRFFLHDGNLDGDYRCIPYDIDRSSGNVSFYPIQAVSEIHSF